MELLSFALTTILAVAGAIIVHMVASDLHERLPFFATLLLKLAVQRLPPSERRRYAEEWASHLLDCESGFAKLWHAVQCFICARSLRKLLERHRVTIQFGDELTSVSIPTALLFTHLLGELIVKRSDDDGGRKEWAGLAGELVSLAKGAPSTTVDSSEVGDLIAACQKAAEGRGGIDVKITAPQKAERSVRN